MTDPDARPTAQSRRTFVDSVGREVEAMPFSVASLRALATYAREAPKDDTTVSPMFQEMVLFLEEAADALATLTEEHVALRANEALAWDLYRASEYGRRPSTLLAPEIYQVGPNAGSGHAYYLKALQLVAETLTVLKPNEIEIRIPKLVAIITNAAASFQAERAKLTAVSPETSEQRRRDFEAGIAADMEHGHWTFTTDLKPYLIESAFAAYLRSEATR